MAHVRDELIGSPSILHFGDSGQSIYLEISHFICETAALRTAAQSVMSKNLNKIPAEGVFQSG